MSSNEDYLNSLLSSVMDDSEKDKTSQREILGNNTNISGDLHESMSDDAGYSEIRDLLGATDENSYADDDLLSLLENEEENHSVTADGLESITQDESGNLGLENFAENLGMNDSIESDAIGVNDMSVEEAMGEGNDLFDIFANEQEEQMPEEEADEQISDDMDAFSDSLDFLQKDETTQSEDAQVYTDESGADQDRVNSELEELLGPVESKQEKKERLKREKQEAKQKAKEEKLKAKEEKARLKAEKAQAKVAGKEKKSQEEEKTENGISEDMSDLGFSADEQSEEDLNQEFDAMLQPKKKKKGFFSRLASSLFEEVPDEESEEGVSVSDENQMIMDEVGNEEIGNTKGAKKGKKDKKAKKGKKGKNTGENEGVDEGQEESGQSTKKDKKKKEKKEKKKEKKAVEKEEDKSSGKKLPKKRMIMIFAVCLTFMAIVIICSLVLPSHWDRKNARKAYYQGDYETVYHLLEGENLNESDRMMYDRSVLVLIMENKLDAYHLNIALGEELDALNELFMAVEFYQSNMEYAQEIGALEEVQKSYQEVLSLLQDHYGIYEERAIEIAGMGKLDYNKELYYLLNGVEFTIPEMGSESVQERPEQELPDERQDLLPEEEEIPQPDENQDELYEDINAEGTADSQEDQAGEETANRLENEDVPEDSILYTGTVENGNVIVQ